MVAALDGEVLAMAESEGVEPLALPRCQRRFSRPFAPASATFRSMRLVEGAGIEPAEPCLGAHGLASRCITTLPTFRRQDEEDDRDRLIGRWRKNFMDASYQRWCPTRDSNPESLASKASAVAVSPAGRGGAGRIRTYTAEPTSGLQPGALPVGRPLRGGPTEIRTQNLQLLRLPRLPITPSARNYSPSRYRNRKVGRGRLDSNQRRAASKAVALPTELRPCRCRDSMVTFMGGILA